MFIKLFRWIACSLVPKKQTKPEDYRPNSPSESYTTEWSSATKVGHKELSPPPPPPPPPLPPILHPKMQGAVSPIIQYTYQGRYLPILGAHHVWADLKETEKLPPAMRQEGYWEASLLLAEVSVAERKDDKITDKNLLGLEGFARNAIAREMEKYDDREQLALIRLNLAGRRKYVQAILLNGKSCEVKTPDKPTLKGIWYCTWESCHINDKKVYLKVEDLGTGTAWITELDHDAEMEKKEDGLL